MPSAPVELGPVVDSLHSIAVNSFGIILIGFDSPTTPDMLAMLDPNDVASGVALPLNRRVLSYGLPDGTIDAMAVSRTGEIYGAQNLAGGNVRLWSVDSSTGQVNHVNDILTGVDTLTGMSFVDDQMLMILGDELNDVSPADGTILGTVALSETGLVGLASAPVVATEPALSVSPAPDGGALVLDVGGLPTRPPAAR